MTLRQILVFIVTLILVIAAVALWPGIVFDWGDGCGFVLADRMGQCRLAAAAFAIDRL